MTEASRPLLSRIRPRLATVDLTVAAQAMILLAAVAVVLRRRGLQGTALALSNCRTARPASRNQLDPDRVAATVAAVARRMPQRSTCVPRAMTTWYLLRRHGLDATIIVGAGVPQGDRLSAHAWVELDGVPLGERSDVGDAHVSFDITFPPLDVGNQ